MQLSQRGHPTYSWDESGFSNWIKMTEYRVLSSEDATKHDVDIFAELVRSGGAVDEYFVRQGVNRPGAKLIFAESDGQAIGVAALKIPSDQYRSGLESGVKAGQPLLHEDYPYELGYVSVSPDHGKRGIGRKLVEIALELAEGKGIFATTSNPAMKDGILQQVGFFQVGNVWKNGKNETLHLLVRSAQKK
ncbi:GNAT family N-acetyltransferase [Rhodovulum bhavnagarense]|nr:GNAT family N-acetyltransferase [Rhodovulum bhavnagarense]